MSHVTDVKFVVPDDELDSLAAAAEEHGLVLRRHQKTHKWYGVWVNDFRGATAAVDTGHDPKTFGTCEHALAQKGNPGGFEIGLVRSKTGKGYDLIYDAWAGGRGLEALAGKGLNALKQSYQARVAAKKAVGHLKSKGFVLQPQQRLSNGVIRLKLRKL